MTIDPQSLSSKLRQAVAVAAIVMGALTSALQGVHLPAALSAILAGGGFVILAVEHYVSDPSTGTPAPPPVPVVKAVPAPPPAAVPAAAPTAPTTANPAA